MKVVLLERVEKLGAIGDVVAVRAGFARNFLLPQHKALRATDNNLKLFETQRAEIEARNALARAAAGTVAETLDGQAFVLIRQAGESGQLYGSVSARDIADAATNGGFKVERSQVALDQPIKNLGLHGIRVRLHAEVSVTVTVNVARSQDEAVRQARGENVIASQQDEDRAQADAQSAELFESSILNEQPAGEEEA
jgi:large subunit ribosomal protein L9